MTRAPAVLVAALVVGGCGGAFEKVPEAEVDAAQKAAALRIGTKIWENCRAGRAEALGADEAIPAMVSGLGPDAQRSSCAQIKASFGDYESMDYAETCKPKLGGLRVYRFRGHFSRSTESPEIRVVMDGNRLSGFWLKPWSDTLR